MALKKEEDTQRYIIINGVQPLPEYLYLHKDLNLDQLQYWGTEKCLTIPLTLTQAKKQMKRAKKTWSSPQVVPITHAEHLEILICHEYIETHSIMETVRTPREFETVLEENIYYTITREMGSIKPLGENFHNIEIIDKFFFNSHVIGHYRVCFNDDSEFIGVFIAGGSFEKGSLSLDDIQIGTDELKFFGVDEHVDVSIDTRSIEILLAWYNHTWSTVFVEIPIDTPEGDIDRVAIDAAISRCGRSKTGDVLVTAAVYNIPEIEEEI